MKLIRNNVSAFPNAPSSDLPPVHFNVNISIPISRRNVGACCPCSFFAFAADETPNAVQEDSFDARSEAGRAYGTERRAVAFSGGVVLWYST
uniref:Uncharacterized protein n=1 Tax=Trichuris muris TaxID=70415 RepID=A0A5S6QDZ7_TRIMR